MAVFFNGRLLVTPDVATQVYDQGMLDQNPSTGNTLAIIGESTGGIPFEPTFLYTIPDAREYLKGGPLLRAVEMAFAPSPETAGPQVICVVRVSSATRSSLTLSNSAANAVASLVSVDYGLTANNLRVKVEAGTLKSAAGYRNISIADQNRQVVGEDVGREGITLLNKTGTGWSYTVDDSALTVTSGGAGSVSVGFATYETVNDVVNILNASPYLTAVTIAGSGERASASAFDSKSAAALNSTTAVTLTQHVAGITEWINLAASGLVSATRTANATINVATATTWSYMTGGTDGASQTDDEYGVALAALETEDVQWIVPISSDSATWARVSTHCTNVSGTQKRERRAFVGGGIGVTNAQAVANAATINNDRVAYVHPGIYHYNTSGLFQTRGLTKYEAYYTAAILGGAFAGLTPGETMTNKSILASGLETEIVAPNNTDMLIRGGVLAIHRDRLGALRVARANSTWLNDSRFNRVEVSTGAAVDYVSRSVREALRPFIGNKVRDSKINLMSDAGNKWNFRFEDCTDKLLIIE